MKVKTKNSGRRPSSNGRSSRRQSNWLTVSAVGIAACGAAGHGVVPPVHAAQLTHNWAVNLFTQNNATYQFEIQPGLLTDVLAAFQKTTGMQVTLSRDGIGMLPSPGIRGEHTADRALAQILAGTGVVYRYTAPAAITLDLQSVTTALDVTEAPPTLATSSPKYTEPLREVPQTIEVIPRAVMEQQGAVSLTDALRNVPGITIQAGEGGGASSTTGDMFNMRGFNASNSLFVDGVRDDGLVSRNIYNIEQVEVFLGPAGSDIGRGTASGYVNMQTKIPNLRPAYSGTLSHDSGNQKRGSLDLNQTIPLGAAGSWLGSGAGRLNALWQQGGVPGRDIVKLKNRSIAPSFALGLGTPTRLTLSSQITRQNNVPDYGIPGAAWKGEPLTSTFVPAANPVNTSNYYGSIGYDVDKVSQDSYTARVEHDVNERLTLRHQTRYNDSYRNAIITGLGAFAPATQTVALTRQGNERQNRIVSSQQTMVARFSTGKLGHAVSSGVEYMYEDQFAPTIAGVGTRLPVDIYNPNPNEPVTDFAPVRTGAVTKGWTNTIALYAFDTVEIGRRLQVSGGLRWEHYNTNFRTLAATGIATTDERAAKGLVSGKAGVLFRITDAGNVYFSYGTTLTPPGTANFTLSAQANNQNNPNVKPQESRNYEVGSKWDFFNNRLSLTGSAFDTENKNVIFTVDATAVPPIFNQDDEQRVKGITAGVIGQVTERFHVLANFGYLDTELRTQNSVNNGRRLTLAAPHSGSFWATYMLPRGISIGGGLRYTDMVYVNAANSIRVPSYTVADALVDYRVNDKLTLRLNVYNVTNETYARSVNNNGNRYNPGSPRSAMVATVFRF